MKNEVQHWNIIIDVANMQDINEDRLVEMFHTLVTMGKLHVIGDYIAVNEKNGKYNIVSIIFNIAITVNRCDVVDLVLHRGYVSLDGTYLKIAEESGHQEVVDLIKNEGTKRLDVGKKTKRSH